MFAKILNTVRTLLEAVVAALITVTQFAEKVTQAVTKTNEFFYMNFSDFYRPEAG